MKKLILFLVAICSGLVTSAQSSDSQEKGFFKHLDASLTVGTTGLGIDLASPMGEYTQLRAGFAFMPHINYKMSFDVQVGDNAEESKSKFQRLSGILKDMTGFTVNNSVGIIGVPTYYNFNMFVDVFPFKNNKHWHFTAGFYLGNSMIAKGYNATEDMASLVAVGIYNTMYEKAIRKEPFVTFTYNGNPVAFTDDPEYQDMLYDKFMDYGRMGVRIGDYVSDGSPYIVEPDENSMVKAEVKVNTFKPYVGFGYGGRLVKGDDRYKISFDCGAMFWGGTPSILTHDGTDLAKDVKNVRGKVGDYVKFVKDVKFFPVLNVRITRTLF